MVWTDVGKSRIDGYADLTERLEKVIEWLGRHINPDEEAEPGGLFRDIRLMQ